MKPRYLSIRSRHPSCKVLRGRIKTPFRCVYRHGSTTQYDGKEINSIKSVQNASSKLLMKQCFDGGKVKHLSWMRLAEAKLIKEGISNGKFTIPFPIVIKHTYGSRGRGNYKIETAQDFNKFLGNKELRNYIVEQFFSGAREYRVHISELGPIYSLRKLLKTETPKEKRWVRNDETCVWITEFEQSRDERGNFRSFRATENGQFDRPTNWKEIVAECKKALTSVGLDVGAVDLKVQSGVDKEGKIRKNPDFFIIEINSAPSFGRITAEIYKEYLPKIAINKYGNSYSTRQRTSSVR